jgi:hypothetical protein
MLPGAPAAVILARAGLLREDSSKIANLGAVLAQLGGRIDEEFVEITNDALYGNSAYLTKRLITSRQECLAVRMACASAVQDIVAMYELVQGKGQLQAKVGMLARRLEASMQTLHTQFSAWFLAAQEAVEDLEEFRRVSGKLQQSADEEDGSQEKLSLVDSLGIAWNWTDQEDRSHSARSTWAASEPLSPPLSNLSDPLSPLSPQSEHQHGSRKRTDHVAGAKTARASLKVLEPALPTTCRPQSRARRGSEDQAWASSVEQAKCELYPKASATRQAERRETVGMELPSLGLQAFSGNPGIAPKPTGIVFRRRSTGRCNSRHKES